MELAQRIRDASPRVNRLGYDEFGFSPDWAAKALPPLLWLYRHYFRVQVDGAENIPDGPVLFVSNHSGQLPLDAAMIGLAALLEAPRPRALRGMADRWISALPFASIFMSRMGSTVGTPENCRRLLKSGEAVLVFPEGARGITKPFKERYQLKSFGQGFLRIALDLEVPIVPVAVVGAEEQYPSLADVRPLAKMLGMPAFPVVLNLLPLPSRYRITFGAPIQFGSTRGSSDVLDEVDDNVETIRATIQRMIDEGVQRRRHIFW